MTVSELIEALRYYEVERGMGARSVLFGETGFEVGVIQIGNQDLFLLPDPLYPYGIPATDSSKGEGEVEEK